MREPHAFLIFPGTNSHECYTVAVRWIHVRLNLEYETCQLIFIRLDRACVTFARTRRWRDIDKLVKQFFNAEIRDRRTKEHWRLFRRQIIVDAELRTSALDEFDFLAKTCRVIA
jgi:hypothetical protein